MVQLCAAIWSNILKGWQRDAGASTGKGNQVITGNQISETRAINTKFCFMLYCSLCAWDPVWRCRKARSCLAASHSCAEPWLGGKASSSVLSVQCGLFTLQRFPLGALIHTLPLCYKLLYWFSVCCSTRRIRSVLPGCKRDPRRAELPDQGPWQHPCPLMWSSPRAGTIRVVMTTVGSCFPFYYLVHYVCFQQRRVYVCVAALVVLDWAPYMVMWMDSRDGAALPLNKLLAPH